MISQSESDYYKIIEKGFPATDYKQTSELLKLLELGEEDAKQAIKNISKQRHIGKQGGYSCQYGAGYLAVSRSAKISAKLAKDIVKAYKKKNWSIQAIAKEQIVVTKSTGKWLYNPINEMYYFIKADKDIFSTLVQGTGSYILDIWLAYTFYLREKEKLPFDLLMTFHDEKVLEFDESKIKEDEIKSLSERALEMVNKKLKLDIPIKCSSDFGYRYSDIH